MDLQPIENGHFKYQLCLTHEEKRRLQPRTTEIYDWGNSQFGRFGIKWGLRIGVEGMYALFTLETDAMNFIMRWR